MSDSPPPIDKHSLPEPPPPLPQTIIRDETSNTSVIGTTGGSSNDGGSLLIGHSAVVAPNAAVDPGFAAPSGFRPLSNISGLAFADGDGKTGANTAGPSAAAPSNYPSRGESRLANSLGLAPAALAGTGIGEEGMDSKSTSAATVTPAGAPGMGRQNNPQIPLIDPVSAAQPSNDEAEGNAASVGSLRRMASLRHSSLNSEPVSAIMLDTRIANGGPQNPTNPTNTAAAKSDIDGGPNRNKFSSGPPVIDQVSQLARSLSMRTGPVPHALEAGIAIDPKSSSDTGNYNSTAAVSGAAAGRVARAQPGLENTNAEASATSHEQAQQNQLAESLEAGTAGKTLPASQEREMSEEEVLAVRSYQLRALTRKTISYQKRQIFVNVCCISLCPFFMVALSALIGSLLQSLINKSIVSEKYLYCSNSDAMNSTSNTPMTDNFKLADYKTLPSLKSSDGFVNLTNFFIKPLTAQGGQPLAVLPQSCVNWGSKDYAYSPIYERDPFSNMTNPVFAAELSSTDPAKASIRKLARMDTTYMADPKYGWLYLKALFQNGALLAQFTKSQTYPWALVQEGSDYNVGINNRSLPVNYDTPSLESLTSLGQKSGLLGAIADKVYLKIGVNSTPSGQQDAFFPKEGHRLPYFEKYPASEVNDNKLDDYLSSYISAAIKNLTDVDKTVLYEKNPSPQQQLKYQTGVNNIISSVPWGAIMFKSMNLQSDTAKITMQVGTDARLSNAGSFPSEGFRRFWLGSMLSTAIMSTLKPGFTIAHGLRVMPAIMSTEISIPFGSLIGRILYPFGVSFLLPIFVIILTQEKEERIMVMMKMNGVRTMYYYITHFIHFYTLHIVVTAVFIISGVLFELEFFTQTSPAVYIVLFFVWGFVQIALGFFISAFFSKSRSALVISFLLVLLDVIINVSVDSLFTDEAPWIYFLWPPFAFYRALSVVNKAAYTKTLRPYNLGMLFNSSDEVFLSLMFQIGGVLFFFPLGLYLSNILPSEFGVRKSWHYPITDYLFSSKKRQAKKDEKEKQNFIANVDEKEAQFEDADVKAERERVDKTEFGPEYPLVIRHMRKIYPGANKIAVKDITLAVEKNSIFGLLGPNGAGKTSLISILTGLYEPTFGEARLGGFNINTQADCVYKVTGICPQHDILWNDLTVEEHLLFYARVKGISPANEKEAVRTAIEAVSLQNFTTRLSKGLSGGEKRRLSIAIALIGNPRAVFFDEPTTGLDPEVRRVIWGIIQAAKRDRTVILTTHSMEEAEVLCQRIGIMAKGTLRCIAPLLRLKNLYGTGFKLVFLAKAENLELARDKITQILPQNASVIDAFQTSMTYEFTPQAGELSRIFAELQKNRTEWKIEDWGISQTSLEEVFLKLVSEGDAEGTAEEN